MSAFVLLTLIQTVMLGLFVGAYIWISAGIFQSKRLLYEQGEDLNYTLKRISDHLISIKTTLENIEREG